ncbi:MAG: hypothetical protein GY795_07085 [Desulfobacterales bacterium]|nr:hypothetical protein [Desulfobacterales bacterium]
MKDDFKCGFLKRLFIISVTMASVSLYSVPVYAAADVDEILSMFSEFNPKVEHELEITHEDILMTFSGTVRMIFTDGSNRDFGSAYSYAGTEARL